MTRVVNIKRVADFDVYIGRAGRGFEGYFGNPVRVGYVCSVCTTHLQTVVHETPASTLPCFKRYFEHRLATDALFKERVEDLRGRVLGCL